VAKKKPAAKASANRAAKLPANRAAYLAASAGRKASSELPASRELLAKELRKLIPKIDEEGLAFLIKQSHTIIYNRHVDEMNRALARVDRLEKRAAKTVSKEEAAEETRSEASSGSFGVWVEDAPGGKSFVVVLGATRKILSRVELRKVVAVAKSGSDDAARSEQLYAWFQKHRGDVLFDARIGSRQHPLLAKLARYLRTHYTVKN
jgi:hypothetical protein